MKKALFVVMFMAVAFVAAAPVAQAQAVWGPAGSGGYGYGYPSPVAQVTASNLAMVDEMSAMAMGGRSYGSMYGDPCMAYIIPFLPNGTRSLIYGSAGTMGGYVIGGSQHRQLGMVVGGILGSVLGEIQDARQRRRAEQAYMACQQHQAAMQYGGSPQGALPSGAVVDDRGQVIMPPVVLPQQVSQPSGQSLGPLAGPAVQGQAGEFQLRNTTRFSVEVYDGGKYLGRMRPREEWRVSAPSSEYKAFALIPNQRGSLSNDETDLQPSDDGWVFVEPQFDP